ncbi:MAG: bifunctional folylpolyglutamate synthase/dihydrofolate synthase, partial [Endomicrobiales bacterium]
MRREKTWREKLSLWQKYEYSGMKPGLERMRAFLKESGNPQEKYKTVQIAGTNGKGSTAAMLSNMLKASGLKAALYTSPHLVAVNERIRVNGRPVRDGELEGLVKRFAPLAEK